jgi:hypothetical protein
LADVIGHAVFSAGLTDVEEPSALLGLAALARAAKEVEEVEGVQVPMVWKPVGAYGPKERKARVERCVVGWAGGEEAPGQTTQSPRGNGVCLGHVSIADFEAWSGAD